MLKILKEKNKDLKFYSVYDSEFNSFGRVLDNLDTEEIVKIGANIEKPESASKYVPSLEDFEKLDISKEIRNKCFGYLPAQVGLCWGHNRNLNAAEWHFSSEINIAVTDIVLILTHLWKIKDGKVDSSEFTAFYVPKGTAIEVYSTSGHYCPCQVSDDGFACVVALPEGTNTPLEEVPDTKLMSAKNKWVIAHKDNEKLIRKGILAGITGTNYKIEY